MFDHTSLPRVGFRMSAWCTDPLHPSLRSSTPKLVLQSNEAACRVHTHLEATSGNVWRDGSIRCIWSMGSRSNICWRLPHILCFIKSCAAAESRADKSNGFCPARMWRKDDGCHCPHLHYPPISICTALWTFWTFKAWAAYSQLEETHHGPKDVIEILRTLSAANGTSSPLGEACYSETREREVRWNTHEMRSASQRKEHLCSCHSNRQLPNSVILDPHGENLLSVF